MTSPSSSAPTVSVSMPPKRRGVPTLSQWYHVVVTRSGSDFTLYIDGVVVDTGIESTPIADAAAPLTLGWGETDWFFELDLR